MSKKRIGIPTALYGNVFGINAKYVNWVSQFGIPVLLTPGISQINDVDALFLPGGSDVADNLTFLTQRSNPHLEWFDKEELPKYIKDKKPIFGVCRGMQTLNVVFGGTLKNLLGSELEYTNKSATEKEKNTAHEEIRIEDNRFIDVDHLQIKYNHIQINSIHHQVIKKLNSNFTIVAKSTKIKNVEAILHRSLPIAGVQWHPEKINDELSIKLFNHILNK